VHILEDSFDLPTTAHFEQVRRELGVPENAQFYGYGGFLIAATANRSLTRDRVSAVYKLSATGPRAVMKFGNEAGGGKESLPGVPLTARRVGANEALPVGLVVQEGETIPEGYALAESLEGPARDEANARVRGSTATSPDKSAATANLVLACRAARDRVVANEGRTAH
jgi:hypothetical protein